MFANIVLSKKFVLVFISLVACASADWIVTTTYTDSSCTNPSSVHAYPNSCAGRSVSTVEGATCTNLGGAGYYYISTPVCAEAYSVPEQFTTTLTVYDASGCSGPAHEFHVPSTDFSDVPMVVWFGDLFPLVSTFTCSSEGALTYSLCLMGNCLGTTVNAGQCEEDIDEMGASKSQVGCVAAPVAAPVDAPVEAPVAAPVSASPSAAPSSAPQSAPVAAPVKKTSNGIALGAHWHVLALAALFVAQL